MLISGEARVDEAMLTGEAVAMLKTPILSNETLLNVDKDRGHVLYAGTKVLLTRSHQERVFLQRLLGSY